MAASILKHAARQACRASSGPQTHVTALTSYIDAKSRHCRAAGLFFCTSWLFETGNTKPAIRRSDTRRAGAQSARRLLASKFTLVDCGGVRRVRTHGHHHAGFLVIPPLQPPSGAFCLASTQFPSRQYWDSPQLPGPCLAAACAPCSGMLATPTASATARLIKFMSRSYSSGTNAGVGFAIPVDTVNRVVPELIRRSQL